ncbi:hypothetical protein ACFKIT_003783 [Vibrio alginolyticus]
MGNILGIVFWCVAFYLLFLVLRKSNRWWKNFTKKLKLTDEQKRELQEQEDDRHYEYAMKLLKELTGIDRAFAGKNVHFQLERVQDELVQIKCPIKRKEIIDLMSAFK